MMDIDKIRDWSSRIAGIGCEIYRRDPARGKMLSDIAAEMLHALVEPQPVPHELTTAEWKEILESQYE